MIYLDNSATTKPNPEVLDAFVRASNKFWGNPSSIHSFGMDADVLLNKARDQVANILGVKQQDIIFTSGGTEGNNIAIRGICAQYASRGKHIITAVTEHPAVLNTVEQLRESGFDVTILPVGRNGQIDVNGLEKAMRQDTILVSIMHVNNETGVIQPIKEIGEVVSKFPKAFFHVDGVQGFSKVQLDLEEAKVHLYTLSGHKFHGLKGTGILFVKSGFEIASPVTGGKQERMIRSGTVNVPGAVAIAKAMRMGIEDYQTKKSELWGIRLNAIELLKKMEGVVMNTPMQNSAPHILNFSVPGVNTEVLLRMMEQGGVFVSTTSACSSKTRAKSAVIYAMTGNEEMAASSVRLSFSYDTTNEEIEKAIALFDEKIKELKDVMSK